MRKYKYTFKDAYDTAAQRGGKLIYDGDLSQTFPSRKKLEWMCKGGHVFSQDLSHVIGQGTWCSRCSSGLYERIVRTHFEQIFKRSFPKVRPAWLRGDKNVPLELDGYCAELGLAFEHNGLQHYRIINNLWHHNAHAFERIQKHDALKVEVCKLRNIALIIVPQIFTDIKLSNLKQFIIGECIKNNIEIPPDSEGMSIDVSKAYSFTEKDKLEFIKVAAKERDIECLSDYYVGVDAHLRFRCLVCLHEWETPAGNIKRKITGCPKCAIQKNNDAKRFSIDFVKSLIEKKGGILLSDYTQARAMIKIQCNKCNNVWECSFDNIRHGYWCAQCAGCKRASIEEMKEIAINRNGKCLTDTYKNAHIKLLWKCNVCETKWEATTNSIKSGSWCPTCGKKRKK